MDIGTRFMQRWDLESETWTRVPILRLETCSGFVNNDSRLDLRLDLTDLRLGLRIAQKDLILICDFHTFLFVDYMCLNACKIAHVLKHCNMFLTERNVFFYRRHVLDHVTHVTQPDQLG